VALELKRVGEVTVVCDADLVNGGDKDVTYAIRHITVEKYREIANRHTRRVPNRRTHQMVEETDDLAVNDEQFDYALSDWTGVVDAKKQPLPCTMDNKALLDPVRRSAIMLRAGANEVVAPEVREESFRPTA
jgi:hypothetical protein